MSDDLASVATAWMDQWFDPEIGLLWNPPGSFDAEGVPGLTVHLVQQGGWYASGLLMRGDDDRAAEVIDALCDIQYDEPGTVWHGTFRRFYEAPHPQPDARIWVDYDPNWRQFIGTTFALMLRRFPGRVPEDRMRAAIALAIAGEPPGRVEPSYSNIALMKAWLDVEHGDPDVGLDLARQVVDRFWRHGTFEEYNSPTYYGVVLFALALWRAESANADLRAWGAEIEAALWRDIARHWHAGLGNMVGPYTRAYGMDMNSYAAHAAMWVWAALGRDATPFPDIDAPFDHSHDLCFGPMAQLIGPEIPDDAVAELTAFSGERVLEQTITDEPRRVATAWLADDVMLGAESTDLNWRGWGQFVPVTAHWRHSDGSVAWLKVHHRGVIDATASPGLLEIDCQGEADIEVVSSHPLPFDATFAGPQRFTIHVGSGGPTALDR